MKTLDVGAADAVRLSKAQRRAIALRVENPGASWKDIATAIRVHHVTVSKWQQKPAFRAVLASAAERYVEDAVDRSRVLLGGLVPRAANVISDIMSMDRTKPPSRDQLAMLNMQASVAREILRAYRVFIGTAGMNLRISNTNSAVNDHREMTVLEATQRRLMALPAEERLEEITALLVAGQMGPTNKFFVVDGHSPSRIGVCARLEVAATSRNRRVWWTLSRTMRRTELPPR